MNINLLPARYSSRLFTLALGLLCTALLITSPHAQQTTANAKQSPEDRVELYQALLDLTNPWTVMCIAAHPDDEDGTSLIVMRRKYGAHTVSLFSTFGEGGQNAIGPELYEELGAIRVRETMAAAEIQGSEPHFLGLKDFGYSKSADEAFKFWGHDEALRRMVLEIRKLRPDVIITNHSVTNNDHGHHQATARLEVEAFDAAADPQRFPEQLKGGVGVWQVQRLFVRAGRSNQAQADTAPVVTIDPNERDPIRDTVYAEEALRALQKHATQGPWPKTVAQLAARFANSSDGRLPVIRYRLVREAKGAEALTIDSHNFLDGLRLPEAVAKQLEPLMIDGRSLTDFIDQRQLVIHTLAASKNEIARSLTNNEVAIGSDARYRLLYQAGRINSAILAAAGITASLSAKNVLIPGESTGFSLKISNHGSQSVQLERLSPPATQVNPNAITLPCCPKDMSNHVIRPGESLEIPLSFSTPNNTGLTVPHAEHLYDDRVFGFTTITYAFARIDNADATIFAHTKVEVSPPVEIVDISPSPFVVTPAIAEPPGVSGLILRTGSPTVPFKIRLINHQDSVFSGELIGGTLKDKSAPRRRIELEKAQDSILKARAPGSFSVIDFGQSGVHPIPNVISFTLLRSGSPEAVSTGRVHAVWADAHVAPNLRVGYIRGFDYSLPHALDALGVESKELSVDEVKTADLQKYSTIIVDNRVYESTPELIAANQKLLDYANNGGTLIVFYHKSFEWNPDARRNRPQLGPYPLTLGDERITDENAPITFIEADHPLLNFPNKMGQEDFVGWIQERGLYYPKDWDAHYHALLQSNDPGETPLKGGLLVADYGRGHYIYTSMVWYRQLRAGVPGAYRMLANMISYGRAK